MATPPSSRGSSLDHTFRPATPESAAAFRRSAASMTVPKSEYLRHALEARRAQNTPVQNTPRLSAIEIPPHPTAPTPLAPHTPAASPDAFDEFDLPEEIMTPESPIRKRRPNDKKDTPPRSKTNQELSAEVEKLRDELFKQNLRVELLKTSNHDLQAKWVKAKEEVDQLKPLEEENYELRAENKQLTRKLAAVQDDIDHIDEIEDELEKLYLERKAAQEADKVLREEILKLGNINKEAAMNMHGLGEAMEEAVEMINSLEGEKLTLEDEKLHLKMELDSLKKRVAVIELKQVDGSGYPQRIHSIDEQQPATSYDDSDYYSQPATPRADVDRDAQSTHSGTSARSKQFIELTKKHTRSARSLSKRMSDISLRATTLASASVSQVPQIPEEFAEVTPRIVDERFRERRYRQDPGVEQLIARSGAEMRRPATVAPAQTQQLGLRGYYRPVQLREPSMARPSTSYAPDMSISSRPRTRNRTHSLVDQYPAPPPRMSSRRARTSDDHEQQPSDGTLDSNTGSGTLVGSGEEQQEQVLTAWAPTHPRTSTVSLLTSPRIDRPDKERWWKDTENVRPLRARATTRTLRTDCSLDEDALGSATFVARAEGVRTNPVTPATERPEQDFLFNPRENEEQFMRKAITRLKESMRRN
ncbi:hypothetical protein OPT61_g5964 [Boeremia exigua]|uniref:Uncharacterized protein n=1 Tax=Boeremia exigua TaxID=749465 RepID=A0ACC2I8K3_9PLEO|nr:hypothetical protein OPT61_g5964 [Boeremia exigua]